ncbi:Swt1 family HEPN domain-containing protein [Mesorhizobium sp. M0028]|uniref:Swt1 family HEPN domain-containing protein n=1 Tax=Mesorhizobium sp. M0028 TaxID=2956849 RepID=UPI003335C475
MSSDHTVELFVIKCAVIEAGLRATLSEFPDTNAAARGEFFDERIEPYIRQFALENRSNAGKMARYYEIFYMLENDIRRLISETLEAAHGPRWWDSHVSPTVKQEAQTNQSREAKAGVTARSDDEIDYTTFGQLGDIIRDNWSDFAGMLSNASAMGRVLSSLNTLRGTIAHCGLLAEDEVDRLKLAIRDWFRVLEGPKS